MGAHYNTCTTRSLVGNDHSAAAGCSSALEASTLGRERESCDVGSGARGTHDDAEGEQERDREAGEGTRCLRKRGGWA